MHISGVIMKLLTSITKLLSGIILLVGVNAFGQVTDIQPDIRMNISSWEPTLPLGEIAVSQLLQVKAYEQFYVEGKDQSCGGEVLSSELVDYYTFFSEDTSTVHKLKLNVHVTGSFNYCEKQTLYICTVPITVKSEKVFGMGKWDCHLVDIEN